MVGAMQPYPGCPWSGGYTEPTALLGFMRQDIDNRQVLWYDPYLDEESLLYDFNMGLGTYPLTYSNPGGSSIPVTAIDSVLLSDGYHKRWVLDTPNANDSTFVIEGVGSSFGLINPMLVGIESGTTLGCFARNDSLMYQHPQLTGSTCDMHVGFAAPISTKAPVLFPNPGTDHLSISLPQGVHVVTLFDALGQQVAQHRESGSQFDMDTRSLRSGIYTVRIDDGSARARWVKE